MKAFLIGTVLLTVVISFYGDATHGQGNRFGAKQESESLEYEAVTPDGEYEYYTVGSLSAYIVTFKIIDPMPSNKKSPTE